MQQCAHILEWYVGKGSGQILAGDKKSGIGDVGGSPEEANWPGLLVGRVISL